MKIIIENDKGKIVMGGGIDSDFNLLSAEGLGLPPKSYTTVEKVGKSGQDTVNVRIMPRIITISGDVFIKDNRNIDKFLDVLAQDVWVTVCKGRKRRKIYTKIKEFEIYNKNGGYSGFVLQLEADEPFFRDVESEENYIFKRENMVTGNIDLPCIFTKRTVGMNITNKGSQRSYPKIIIYDMGSNGKNVTEKSLGFINKKTGATVMFEYGTSTGEVVTVDFDKRKAFSNISGDISGFLALENYLSAFYFDAGENFIDVINNTDREVSPVCIHENYYNECL